jgi:hypothetical protein
MKAREWSVEEVVDLVEIFEHGRSFDPDVSVERGFAADLISEVATAMDLEDGRIGDGSPKSISLTIRKDPSNWQNADKFFDSLMRSVRTSVERGKLDRERLQKTSQYSAIYDMLRNAIESGSGTNGSACAIAVNGFGLNNRELFRFDDADAPWQPAVPQQKKTLWDRLLAIFR